MCNAVYWYWVTCQITCWITCLVTCWVTWYVRFLYYSNVWKHHGLPRKVVSNHRPQFVAEFTWELYQMLGNKLAATTAYHPQGDGQMERVNQELEQYLGLFVNQRWCAARPVKGGCLAEVLYSVLGVLCVAWSLSWVKLASALIVKGLQKGENAKQGV